MPQILEDARIYVSLYQATVILVFALTMLKLQPVMVKLPVYAKVEKSYNQVVSVLQVCIMYIYIQYKYIVYL